MNTPRIDLVADLNCEDDDGRRCSLLRDARDPRLIHTGAVVVAGRGDFWTCARVVAVDDDGQVHFDSLADDDPDAAGALVAARRFAVGTPPMRGRPRGGISPEIALWADFNNEDDEGFGWTTLRNARDALAIVKGALVVAGTEGFWGVAEIRAVDDDGMVHFRVLPSNDPSAEHLLRGDP